MRLNCINFKSSSLAEVYANFMNEVNSYSLFWDEMKMIDERCWVLEPLRPSKTDCWRRIKLDSNVSLDIRVDARNATELPEIFFLGSEAATEAFRHKLESKYDEWNPNISIVYNLGELLEIKLPSKCEQEEITSIKCAVCNSYLLNNQGPNIFCEDCNKPFHEQCLYEWLKNSAKFKQYFGCIYGPCPNCNQSIKCKIMADQA